MKRRIDKYNGYKQQDAAEFIMNLITEMLKGIPDSQKEAPTTMRSKPKSALKDLILNF